MRLPFRRSARTTTETPQIRLEREGRDEIRRITSAVEKVPWTISLLQILWTAGPVTLLGAWGGFLLGYGKAPTAENYIFFISYTVITGAAGIIANVVHNLAGGRKAERTAGKIERVIKSLPDLLLATRNLIVESLEGDARRREAAAMLLRKQDLSPEGVELAAIELLDDRDSARIIAQIDIYRRVGQHARIRDLIALYRETIDPQLNELAALIPEATALLRQRFEGQAPDLRRGVARDDNFIERVLAAIEQNNELLMTLQDVEEMLILAFELISGRKIPMLTFEYRGRWRLAQAFDNLEKARAQHRIAQATGLSRLKALTAYLAEQSGTLVEDAAGGLRAEILLERSQQAMDALAEQIQHLAQAVNAGQTERRASLRAKADLLTNALRLYRTALNAYEQAGRSHAQLLKASQHWDAISADLADGDTRLRLGPGRRGLRIREHVIALDDAAKAQVCKHLDRHIKTIQIDHQQLRNPHFVDRERLLATGIDASRRLAIEIALALEPHIQLSRPQVQRAINGSNAADFGQLEPNLSAAAKAALGAAMVREIDVDLSRTAESLAVALVRHYRVELDPGAQTFLINQYGAREATLNMLSNYLSNTSRGDTRNVSYLSQRPAVVNAPHRDWYRALVQARRALR
ncbi:hypothetical protein SAMN02745148_03151 [Modicisalibacter ilicicola DSM 19980]|uniref:Uncharacterized protein n=1 Tax=Modicisalibacter ilicicola DSM 19980 TaxID=1121942 RepID=A0A1M5D7Z1_9GAMM|nr:hypothetical protein [Halomonas ilicicola]SHF63128.1 hypothetical protein SAMN02745148_03151 [Halomonas ilicicola DSM 19980]